MVIYKVLNQQVTEEYSIYNADCCEGIQNIPDCSIDFSICSPPFANLYTYSNSDRDMGNCKNEDEFGNHIKFLIKELYRVIRPGRLVSWHVMNLPSSIQRDGFIGIKDFRGDIIRQFQESGFIYHSEVCIWKNPVVAMQRTKALGLLHKQVMKDRSMSRQGIPDYVVTFRKPGKNEHPISGKFEYFAGDYELPSSDDDTKHSIEIWQRYASPVWMDINPSDTLQFRSARENDDERHICPLQLQVIERCLQLWTNPGDTVLTPFMGIGSEVWQSVKMNRKGIGFELKQSYYDCAVKNLEKLVSEKQLSLF